MTSRSMSPRRRHILSSINPEPAHPQSNACKQHNESRTGASHIEKSQSHDPLGENVRGYRAVAENDGDDNDGDSRRQKPSKFRFKSKSSSSRHHSSRRHRERDYQDEDLESQMDPRYRADYDPEHDGSGREEPDANTAEPTTASQRHRDHDSSRNSRHHRHRSHRHRDETHEDREHRHRSNSRDRDYDPDSSSRRHRHKRRRREHHHRSRDHRTRSPTPPNPHDPPPLDPDAAFRESLFDAMADDEGAAYWEAVYGQPIHVYSRGSSNPADPAGRNGELEQMTDEEYAAHVRQKMWEKTHEGLVEERNRREEAKKRKAAESEQAARLTREMERSLKRGDERRRKRIWREKWDIYTETWENWDGSVAKIPWPIDIASHRSTTTGPELDGFVKDNEGEIDTTGIREFFVTALDPHEVGETEYLTKLKSERVRWHPDKMQQRLVGSAKSGKFDEVVMRNVTAVFQVIDKLWADTRVRQMK